ncbi:alpha/beta fold hydrolase BchO [Tropicimonas sp. S265A]|uniref:alpha/beta fold hydrolase BchO n=1 Tax=Tropicimonas sp. S265A TaxID=3415134 RepID=UPI003C7998E2
MNWDLEKAHWPHAQYSRFVRVRPHQWHVQRQGSGPGLLLLHGAAASLHSFADLIPRLTDRYDVMAVDLPGHGFTTKGSAMRSSLTSVSSDLATLLDHEGFSPQCIVGHSAGAAVALDLSLRLPDPPKAVVAINGAFAEFDGVAGWLFPMLAKLLALNPFTSLFFASTTTPRNVSQLIAATGSELSDVQLRLYYRLIRDRAHVAGALAMMAQWDLRPLIARLGDFDIPTLLLTGDRDKAVAPAVSRDAAARMPNALWKSMPALGHLMHEERPDLVAEVILDFLADPISAQTQGAA